MRRILWMVAAMLVVAAASEARPLRNIPSGVLDADAGACAMVDLSSLDGYDNVPLR